MDRRVCVVTGSSAGIGAATARTFAGHGWDVAINFSRDPAPAEDGADQCRALGAQAIVVRADVADDADCRRLAAGVERHFGRADVLVNNAGTTKVVGLKDLDGLSAEDFHAIYGVNVIGTYQMTRAFVPMLKAHPGSAVVNISSIASMIGVGTSLAYMASKGALNALTIGLARALAPEIRVNAIAPGMVETRWLQNGLGAERYAATAQGYRARAALEAIVDAQDVADAAWFLGASAAKTTGEVLLVDAGFRITKA